MKPAFPASVCLILAAVASQPAWAETYRWVDGQGRVHYGDILPNKGSDAVTRMDKEGRLRGLLQRQPDTEARTRQFPSVEQGTQKRYDNALLSTYLNEMEIDLARERGMEIERTRLKSMQERLGEVRSRLGSLNAEIEGYRKVGMGVQPPLLQMKREAEIELISLSDQVQLANQAVDSIWTRYEAAKQRFRQLKGSQD